MSRLTIDTSGCLLTQSYLDDLWEQPRDEVVDCLLHHIQVMQQREARKHAVVAL